jgi:hypothetical protein
LLLQLLLLLLLAFSVADPYFPWQLLQARRIVAVIDNSASMQAADVSPSRYRAAVASALSLVDELRFRDEMAVVVAGPSPEVALGMSSHVPTLKRTLNAIKVTDNPTQLRPAIELGKRLIGEHPRGQIVVFTDACAPSLAGDELEQADDATSADSRQEAEVASSVTKKPAGEQARQSADQANVEYRVFATRAANVGIVQFQVRRSLIDPVGYQVLAKVYNAADAPVQCRLEIELDQSPVDVVPLELKPDELWSRTIEKTSLEGGTLIGTLTNFERVLATTESSEDSAEAAASTPLNQLAVDDVAYAILPGREMQRVLIVTRGNLFLQKVFEANPLVQVDVVAGFPSSWPPDTILVFDRETPAELPANDLFVVDPKTDCSGWEVGEPIMDPIVTQQDKDSPLMKHVRLDNVLMPEARKISIRGKSRALAGALSEDPVYVEVQRDEGKCLVLTVNLDKSDLAFRTAFPIMVTNALGWFAGTSGELQIASPTGTAILYQPEEKLNSMQMTLTSPSGVEHLLAVSQPRVPVDRDKRTADENDLSLRDSGQTAAEIDASLSLTLGPFDESGIWALSTASPNAAMNRDSSTAGDQQTSGTRPTNPVSRFAASVASRRETDLRPPEEMRKNVETQALASGFLARPVWFYLVAVGCLLTMIEWFLYQRRITS